MGNISRLGTLAILVSVVACSDWSPSATGTHAPTFDISDAAHSGGNPHFFFLPPMVPQPSFSGTFDASQTPSVQVCEWTETACVLPLLAEFTMTTGPGSETVRVVPTDELYIANWHTDGFGLDPAKTYRIRVLVDATEIGHADVDVVSTGRELRNVNRGAFIPLLNGRTLPIKFRIEEGAIRPRWIELSPSSGPPAARRDFSAVLGAAGQMVVFGGIIDDVPTKVNDVWRLTNADGTSQPAWISVAPQGGPPAERLAHRAVYDAANDRMIVYGGALGNLLPCAGDAWVLSDASGVAGTPSWTQLNPSGTPQARLNHSAVYDAAGNRLIVYGGNCGEATGLLSDVWVLSNANGLAGAPAWTQLSPSGSPPGRDVHTAVYDAANNRMIVFGGRVPGGNTNEVWVLSNANGQGGTPAWTQLLPTGTPPSERANASAVYDAANNRMIVFGGGGASGQVNDVWILANANGLGGTPSWTQLSPSGAPPAARGDHEALYNPTTNRMIIFAGGNATTGFFNDVWVLTRANGR